MQSLVHIVYNSNWISFYKQYYNNLIVFVHDTNSLVHIDLIKTRKYFVHQKCFGWNWPSSSLEKDFLMSNIFTFSISPPFEGGCGLSQKQSLNPYTTAYCHVLKLARKKILKYSHGIFAISLLSLITNDICPPFEETWIPKGKSRLVKISSVVLEKNFLLHQNIFCYFILEYEMYI